MDQTTLINFIEILGFTLQILIVARVLMSWFRPNPTGPIGRFLVEVTDPILLPLQKLIPPMAGLDFSPILALIALQVLTALARSALTG